MALSQLHIGEKECAPVDSHLYSLPAFEAIPIIEMILRHRIPHSRDQPLSGPTPIAPSNTTPASIPTIPSESQPQQQSTSHSPSYNYSPAYEAWRQSRGTQDGNPGVPTSHRAVTFKNLALAVQAVRFSAVHLFILLWGVHPVRMTMLLVLNLIRGTLPAIRCYSQALLLDEAQIAVACHSVSERLIWLVLLEIFRMLGERLFEHVASQNENLVQQNVRFRVEYLQMQTQLRLDIPSLSDPEVQDLLTEADAFARSFSGMGGLGLLSPFDLIRTLTTIASELLSQSYILWTLMVALPSSGDRQSPWSFDSPQLIIIGSALLPTLLSVLNSAWTRFYNAYADESWSRSLYSTEQSAAAEQHERMRRLAYDGSFKSEILLFGLADWILQTWKETRDIMVEMKDNPKRNAHRVTEFVDSSARELFTTLQAIPLIVQLSTTSLGSVTLYRTAIQNIVMSLKTLSQTFQMTFQGIFLMAAFHAALNLRPVMEPKEAEAVTYKTMVGERGRQGMKIEARNLSFTYPGASEPAIRNLNLTIQPGETIAIVGHNGGGKTTLMHLLLRLYEHDGQGGELLINDIDAREYSAADIHSHSTAVFQGFSRLTNASVRENTGIGCVSKLKEDECIKAALREAGALDLVENSMPNGIDTKLDAGGFRSHSQTPTVLADPRHYSRGRPGDVGNRGRLTPAQDRFPLSGGQWQRIAISRAFMRPDADLVVLDEASSQLDAHAQNEIFSNMTKEAGKKTVIYITHRLSTVRWADKIAFFDKGTVTEFGTHDDLMLLNGSYASLYNAFMTTGS